MKYRIKEELYSDGRHFFKPQYRYRFWPFWFYWWRSDTCGSLSSVSYASVKAAANHIEYQKEQVTISIVIHNVD